MFVSASADQGSLNFLDLDAQGPGPRTPQGSACLLGRDEGWGSQAQARPVWRPHVQRHRAGSAIVQAAGRLPGPPPSPSLPFPACEMGYRTALGCSPAVRILWRGDALHRNLKCSTSKAAASTGSEPSQLRPRPPPPNPHGSRPGAARAHFRRVPDPRHQQGAPHSPDPASRSRG